MANISQKEEIEMLLPLYVNGTLSQDEHVKVETYLKDHPDMAFQLELIEQERVANITSNEQLGTVSPQALGKLHEKLDAFEELHTRQKASVFQNITDFIKNLTDFEHAIGKLALGAAVILILIQASIIGSFVLNEADPKGQQIATKPHKYQVANDSEGIPQTKGVSLIINFHETATIKDIISLISKFRATIISGPTEDGYFTVKISDKKLSEDQIDDIISKLQSQEKLVNFVGVNE